MANATETLKAQVEAASWVFVMSHIRKWGQENPEGTFDDFIEDCRKSTNAATDRLVDIEVENGSTRTDAERMIRQMY